MNLIVQYWWYDSIVSALQLTWRRYVAVSKRSIYYFRVLLLGPWLIILMLILRALTRLVVKIDPAKSVAHLSPQRYQRIMKNGDSLKRLQMIHSHLTRSDAVNHPIAKKIIRQMVVKDLSAVIVYQQKLLAAVDQKLASKDGNVLKAVNHNDLWANRAKVYAYKF